MVEQINKDEFDEFLKVDKPVVCDFFATWCGPCKMLAPVMEQMSEQFQGKAVFVKVDIDKEPELAIRYGIMSIPLVSVFKNGEEAGKSLGYMSKSEAEEFLRENL